jgi:hypothetical protein
MNGFCKTACKTKKRAEPKALTLQLLFTLIDQINR